MRLTLSRAALLSALSAAVSVVERRVTVPITGTVRLDAGADGLRVSGTDMDIEIAVRVPAGTDLSIAAPGSTCVSAHELHAILRLQPEGAQVELAYDAHAQALILRCARYRAKLAALPPDDFPFMPEPGDGAQFSLRADLTAALLRRSRFAVSTEETRSYLNGVYLHLVETGDGRRLCLAATDGHRLARLTAPLPDDLVGDLPGVIVPRKTLGLLAKLLDGADAAAPVAWVVTATKVMVTIGAIRVISKLIDGTFPDYAQVIPAADDAATVVNVDRKLLLASLDRVASISTERGRAVKLTLAGADLTLEASSPETGTAIESIGDVAVTGRVIEIGFNSRYLHDVLDAAGGDGAVSLAMIDAASPARVTIPGDDAGLFIIMPMRV